MQNDYEWTPVYAGVRERERERERGGGGTWTTNWLNFCFVPESLSVQNERKCDTSVKRVHVFEMCSVLVSSLIGFENGKAKVKVVPVLD